MYKVQPYIWNKLDDKETLFQTQNSTVVIMNKALADFLISIEEAQIININDKMVEKEFGSKSSEVLEFLENNELIKKEIKKEVSIKCIYVLCNDKKFEESFNFNLSEDYSIKYIEMEKLLALNFEKNDCLLVFLNPFSIETLEKIAIIVKEKNIISKFIFSYNNRIYFSNFYKKDWYNPCPLCFFYELESQLRGDNSENHINFQTIIDVLYAKHGIFETELPLEKSIYLQIIYLLTQYLVPDINENKIDEVIELDLKDGSVVKDIAYHWGYCDCYE